MPTRWIDRQIAFLKYSKRRWVQSTGMKQMCDDRNKISVNKKPRRKWKLRARINPTYKHPMQFWMDIQTWSMK
jgi:hypothetical protein